MTADFCVALTTVPNRERARAIARTLVEQRLAACVQMLPIESVFTWQDRLEESAEILLLIKIKRADYAQLQQAILSLHDYETPEIIALPIVEGSAPYLEWIKATTRRKSQE
ncbi:MAG TPA: divalent-cation tolerance protein CutA [Methylovirgula sp.]|nr:divalent-cation tolerance protein CutA [Methylovirgula sp.]